MEKELIVEEFAAEEQKGLEDIVFYSEVDGKMVDFTILIYEKLWESQNIKPSECNLKDNAEGWKSIAKALSAALFADYGFYKSDIVELTKENNKITYTNLIKAINPAEPKDVVDKIKGFLAHRELDPEQILYGLGLILDKNKEAYITSLKQNLAEMKHQLNEVVNENNKFRERLNKVEARKAQYPLKKRIVVVKHKKDGE